MGKVLNELSKELEKAISKQEKEQSEQVKDKWEDYASLFNKKEEFELIFDAVDLEGHLSYVDDMGITFIFSAETFKKTAAYYTPAIRDRFLGIKLLVRILEMDEEKRTISVESAKKAVSIEQILKTKAVKEIDKELEKEQVVRIIAEVDRIEEKYIVVNIFGIGIRGILRVQEWSNTYVRNMNNVCKKGDILHFDVLEKYTRVANKPLAYKLSRKNITANPWENLPEDLKEGLDIIVTCQEIPDGKSYWWGISDRVPGIEIMGDFTQRTKIEPGLSYRCKIDKLDKEKRKLRVVPFSNRGEKGGIILKG